MGTMDARSSMSPSAAGGREVSASQGGHSHGETLPRLARGAPLHRRWRSSASPRPSGRGDRSMVLMPERGPYPLILHVDQSCSTELLLYSAAAMLRITICRIPPWRR